MYGALLENKLMPLGPIPDTPVFMPDMRRKSTIFQLYPSGEQLLWHGEEALGKLWPSVVLTCINTRLRGMSLLKCEPVKSCAPVEEG